VLFQERALVISEAVRRHPVFHIFVLLAVLFILGSTLIPEESNEPVEWRHFFCLFCARTQLADGLSNLALFLPLGVAFGALQARWYRSLLAAGALSLSVELLQFVIPGREPGLGDVIFNTAGAAVGLGLARAAPWVAFPTTKLASHLSLLAAVGAAAVFISTDALLRPSLPETDYFGGSASLQATGQPLRLGGSTEPDEYFEGRIDEVRIYGRTQTASEIQTDMQTPVPVGATPPSPGLVAAYSFDEDAGPVLTDASGQGNEGRIRGARWTSEGRFGGALSFNGVSDVVVIPPSPLLELERAMTLQAWIYPTAVQRGWRAVLQKEFDAYFLLAGSRAGPLKPAGGGTFGYSTERLAAPAVVPLNVWPHVALTYDGALVSLYVNGDLVARRLRWYPGRVQSVTVDDKEIPDGPVTASHELRARLLMGAPVTVRAVSAGRVATMAPLVTIHDRSKNEIFFLAADGEDIVIRLRTRAAAAELDTPAIRATGVLKGIDPAAAMTVTVRRSGGTYCVAVNYETTCGLGHTLGTGWALLAYSQVTWRWPHAVLNALWLTALTFPSGFWFRRRRESLFALLVLVMGALVPSTLGVLALPALEASAGLFGFSAGWICSRVVRSTRCAGTQDLQPHATS
jgi:glycopeptide antibiotics resistance protein